ncbi:flagellar protein FlaG [Colwellia sp. RSH04]|uniref:flagellar protein FlaG n=1 Tax=Colwellia sp. RSH04 TaxID=2305464 RepID=UPI000E568CE5|nr:flagellar protein FlaG [Colwellia sp. RSH04]RHW75960.1 hypothetical protein D1094_09825 [Colwellia sp. RSH04]
MSVEQVPTDQALVSLSGLKSLEVNADNALADKKSVDKRALDETSSQPIANQAEKILEKKQMEKAELAEQEKESAENKEEVEQSLEVINELLPLKNTNLIFEFDDIAEPPIVKVVDKNTDEIIREIPPKNLKKITQALNDMADSINKTGALFNSEV